MSGLKDMINRNISDNTSGDITAEIMRETLNLIVDYAEKGYKYGGIILPQDMPVLPGDIPSVYIARYKGAYVNFSGIEIYQDGLYLFMNNGNGRYYLITLYALKDELGNDAYTLLSQKTITKALNDLKNNIFNSLRNVESSLSSNITAYADGRTSLLSFTTMIDGTVLYEYAPFTEKPEILLHRNLNYGFVILVNGRCYAYWNEYISNIYGTGIVHDHTYYNDINSKAKPGLYYNVNTKQVQLISRIKETRNEFLVDKTYAESRYVNTEAYNKGISIINNNIELIQQKKANVISILGDFINPLTLLILQGPYIYTALVDEGSCFEIIYSNNQIDGTDDVWVVLSITAIPNSLTFNIPSIYNVYYANGRPADIVLEPNSIIIFHMQRVLTNLLIDRKTFKP